MDKFLDLPRQFGRVLTSKEHNGCDVLPVGQGGSTPTTKLGCREFPFAVVSRLPRMAPKRKSQALKSGSNQMAVQLAVRVRGKIGDECLVMRSRFAVMREFWF